MEEKIDTNDSFFKKFLLPEFRDALPTPKSKNSTKTESNSKKKKFNAGYESAYDPQKVQE